MKRSERDALRSKIIGVAVVFIVLMVGLVIWNETMGLKSKALASRPPANDETNELATERQSAVAPAPAGTGSYVDDNPCVGFIAFVSTIDCTRAVETTLYRPEYEQDIRTYQNERGKPYASIQKNCRSEVAAEADAMVGEINGQAISMVTSSLANDAAAGGNIADEALRRCSVVASNWMIANGGRYGLNSRP